MAVSPPNDAASLLPAFNPTSEAPKAKEEPSLADSELTRLAASHIGGFSEQQRRMFENYAELRIFGMRGTLKGCSGGDLFNEAIRLTLDETRPWKMGITLQAHLYGCMKSIASGWFKKAARETELEDKYPSADSPEAEIAAREVIEMLQSRFQNVVTRRILELTLDGYTCSEILKTLNIHDNVYFAAKKRIYREVRNLMESSKGSSNAQR